MHMPCTRRAHAVHTPCTRRAHAVHTPCTPHAQVQQIADDRATSAAALSARLAAASPQAPSLSGASPAAAALTPHAAPQHAAPEDDGAEEEEEDDDDRPLSSFVNNGVPTPPPRAAAATTAAATAATSASAAAALPAAVALAAPVLSPLQERLERPNAKELVRQLLARRSRMLLQLLEAEYMLATAPRRAAAPARGWEVGPTDVVAPLPRDKEVGALVLLQAAEAGGGVALQWEAPRVMQLLPAQAVAYELQHRAPGGGAPRGARHDAGSGGGGAAAAGGREDPGLVADEERGEERGEVGGEVGGERGGSWQRAHEHALREPRASPAELRAGLRASDDFRVRAFCGIFGWGPWVQLTPGGEGGAT